VSLDNGPFIFRKKPTPPKRTPHSALQIVYDLACEMSHCSSYAELDETEQYAGTNQDVLDALSKVKKFFKLKGDP
jgi:hypothetical protein